MVERTTVITVCICTYKRPKYLGELVHALDRQVLSEGMRHNIVIVDNDRRESARDVVEVLKQRVSVPIGYFVEPEQNIALARNRAIAAADGEFIAFIDDDEVPEPRWLITLHATCREFDAAGVLGPVLPHYEIVPPSWVTRGRFHERPNHRTGEVLAWTNTRTGNVVFRRSVFDRRDNRFRAEFGSGGEDREFFRRVIAQGLRFVWCAEAPVYEAVPASRCTRSFMLRRALLRGQLPHFTAIHLVRSLVAVPLYTVSLPVLLLCSHHLFMKYLIKDCDHIARILAFCGVHLIKEKYIHE